jgi:heat-inducible transcriptional repressor
MPDPRHQRLQQLLRAIVEEYIRTAKPVGSKALADAYGFEFSPATIRNDMAVLEEDGYIVQPHTSAGRVPTEQGYQYYIRHFLTGEQPRHLNRRQKESLELAAAKQQRRDNHDLFRQLAKTMAQLTNEAVIVSAPDADYYYTGISHILAKPDFAETQTLVSVGEVFDRLDELMQAVNSAMTEQLQVMIGHDNPISQQCALIVAQYDGEGNQRGMIGILGPMRMDYAKNIAILQYAESLIEQGDD